MYIRAPVFDAETALNLLVAIIFFVPTYSYKAYDGTKANHNHILIFVHNILKFTNHTLYMSYMLALFSILEA